MGGINYEDNPPNCYNDFEDAEMYLPVFGEESVAESCVRYDGSDNMSVEDSLPCGVVEKDLGFTVEEKSVAGEEVYGESGFTVKEEEVLAKFKGFFTRRALAKAKKKGNLDLEINGRPTIDVTSTVMPATKEDKGLDLIRVPGTNIIEKPTAEKEIGALVKAAAERKKKRKAEERDKEREALQKAERSNKKKEEEQEVKENGKELMEDAKKEGAGTRDTQTD